MPETYSGYQGGNSFAAFTAAVGVLAHGVCACAALSQIVADSMGVMHGKT